MKQANRVNASSKLKLVPAAVLLAAALAALCFVPLTRAFGPDGPIVETAATESFVPEYSAFEIGEEYPVDPTQGDYSRFKHSNPSHSRLPCLLCHRRDDNSARLRFPGKPDHLPCAGCHTPQFSDPASPMCGICHTNAQAGAMRAFPPLRSFSARFDHGRHSRQANCATCHKSSRRGVAFSMPRGSSAHVTCFQCHTAKTPLGSCDTCHTAGRPVRASENAKAFGLNFSHQEHGRRGLNCSSCHTIRAGAARGRQVSSPLASMHFAPAQAASCAGCHNGKRAFGADKFANCKRCHEGRTFKF